MNALAKLAPVMIAMCCLLILGTVGALVVSLNNMANHEYDNRILYSAINLIYLVEIGFIATVLWLLKDTTRALSYYFYMFLVFCLNVTSQFLPVNISLLQALSGVVILSMINILVQSYFIQPKQLATGYIAFGWALLVQQIIYIAFPYYASSHYLSIKSYRYLSLVNIIPYIALLITLIIITQYIDAERIKQQLNAVPKNDINPYSNL